MTEHEHHDHEDENTPGLVVFARHLVTEQAEQGWDLPPIIALVFAHPLQAGTTDAMLEARGLDVGRLAQEVDPVTLTRAAAMAVRMSPVGSPLPFDPWPTNAEFVGAVLIVESWAVGGSTKHDPDGFARVRAYVEAGNNLADHPDAYEAKCVALVTEDGDVIAATYDRRNDEVTCTVSPWGDDMGGVPTSIAMLTLAAHDRHEAERQNAS